MRCPRLVHDYSRLRHYHRFVLWLNHPQVLLLLLHVLLHRQLARQTDVQPARRPPFLRRLPPALAPAPLLFLLLLHFQTICLIYIIVSGPLRVCLMVDVAMRVKVPAPITKSSVT